LILIIFAGATIASSHGSGREVTEMNARLMIPALLMALACSSLMAADAKHDDHGSAPAHEPQAKPAPAKPAEKHASDAKPSAEAKPAADTKLADAHTEEPAKPAPKKKRAKKAKKAASHDAHAPAAAAHGSTPSPAHGSDSQAPAHGDKANAAADAHAAPEPSKRLKLRKGVAGATQDPHAADSHAGAAAHTDTPTATAIATPAPPADTHAVPAAPAAASHGAHADAPPAQASAPAPSHAQEDAHALVAAPAPASKRVKMKKPLPATPATDTHAATPASPPPPADTHAAPAAAATAHSAHAKDEHAGHDAHAKHDAPAAAASPVAAKALPAHSGHSAMTVGAPHPAEECDMPLKAEIAALFDRWNASLRTGDPRRVVANYAPNSILLPTVSNRARFTIAEKEDYFTHFLMKRPEGSIDDRLIEVDCNSATDAGLYTFRFADGTKVKARYSFSYKKIGNEWLITSHHSSAMPEQAAAAHEAPVTHAAAAPPAPKAQAAAPREDSVPSTKGWVRFP
jgi:uncharacterized protein (TIGR02246 family)